MRTRVAYLARQLHAAQQGTIMSDGKSFQNPDGSTSLAGQQNWGRHEAERGGPATPQQSHESAPAFGARMDAYHAHSTDKS